MAKAEKTTGIIPPTNNIANWRFKNIDSINSVNVTYAANKASDNAAEAIAKPFPVAAVFPTESKISVLVRTLW
jgi:hypothetical protein